MEEVVTLEEISIRNVPFRLQICHLIMERADLNSQYFHRCKRIASLRH